MLTHFLKTSSRSFEYLFPGKSGGSFSTILYITAISPCPLNACSKVQSSYIIQPMDLKNKGIFGFRKEQQATEFSRHKRQGGIWIAGPLYYLSTEIPK